MNGLSRAKHLGVGGPFAQTPTAPIQLGKKRRDQTVVHAGEAHRDETAPPCDARRFRLLSAIRTMRKKVTAKELFSPGRLKTNLRNLLADARKTEPEAKPVPVARQQQL